MQTDDIPFRESRVTVIEEVCPAHQFEAVLLRRCATKLLAERKCKENPYDMIGQYPYHLAG
jgi:hypothetical protein